MKDASGGRRQFLTRLAWLGASVLLPTRGIAAAADPGGATLVGLLRYPESAGVVGREYLRLVAAEREPERLADLIGARCGAGLGAADRATRRACLRHGIHQDFLEGRVVKVRGWVLSVTEARVCALAALAPAGAIHRRR